MPEAQASVEKDFNGKKRKYLAGIASGIKTDLHGERMTENAIKSFMEQANSEDILLYPDIHGIRSSEDIGILARAEVLPTGDWYTEYRLYDNEDGVGDMTLEKVDKIWRQVNGLPPYRKPRRKGFSVEGYIPDNGILTVDKDGRRVINDVKLDGVVLVPRPAYNDSIAHAVYKALGETPPWITKLSFRVDYDEEDSFWYKKTILFTELEKAIAEIITRNEGDIVEDIEGLINEFKKYFIDLIINHRDNLKDYYDDDDIDYAVSIYQQGRQQVFEALRTQVQQLQQLIEKRRQ